MGRLEQVRAVVMAAIGAGVNLCLTCLCHPWSQVSDVGKGGMWWHGQAGGRA
jgi:hypothetical protein